MIDDLFNLIINKSPKISQIEMLKIILYTLYQLEIEQFQNILSRVKREELINLYNLCKSYNTDNFLSYYKKTIINKYTDNTT